MSDQRYSVTIRSGGRTIVSVDDFAVSRDEVTFLFGESGIGKSMLCKAIYGLIDPDELSVTVNRKPYRSFLDDPETRAVRASSFFVFQEPSSHLQPLMPIAAQLREGSIADGKGEEAILGRLWEGRDDAGIRAILDVFPKPYRPSGGEKQRVLLAMAFKKIAMLGGPGADGRPTFFVFDEPTGSLDNNYRNLFLSFLFERFEKRPFTAMIITHDYSIISEVYKTHRRLVDRVRFRELSRLGDGRVELRDFSVDAYLSWLHAAGATAQEKSAGQPVLEVKSEFSIFGRNHRIFSDPGRTRPSDLVLRAGEMVYVKAPSGVGKTTLAKIIMGLYRPDKFSMTLCGMKVTEATPQRFFATRVWGRRAGMVFQHADEALDLEATVAETFKGLSSGRAFSRDELVRTLGELFEGGVTDAFLAKKVKYLSGGQKQRLNLLRTIVLHPDLIILDEPLNGLDFDSVRKIVTMLETLRKKGVALFMISHNEEIFDALTGEEQVYYLT